jgi:hypothetical protein
MTNKNNSRSLISINKKKTSVPTNFNRAACMSEQDFVRFSFGKFFNALLYTKQIVHVMEISYRKGVNNKREEKKTHQFRNCERNCTSFHREIFHGSSSADFPVLIYSNSNLAYRDLTFHRHYDSIFHSAAFAVS